MSIKIPETLANDIDQRFRAWESNRASQDELELMGLLNSGNDFVLDHGGEKRIGSMAYAKRIANWRAGLLITPEAGKMHAILGEGAKLPIHQEALDDGRYDPSVEARTCQRLLVNGLATGSVSVRFMVERWERGELCTYKPLAEVDDLAEHLPHEFLRRTVLSLNGGEAWKLIADEFRRLTLRVEKT